MEGLLLEIVALMIMLRLHLQLFDTYVLFCALRQGWQVKHLELRSG